MDTSIEQGIPAGQRDVIIFVQGNRATNISVRSEATFVGHSAQWRMLCNPGLCHHICRIQVA